MFKESLFRDLRDGDVIEALGYDIPIRRRSVGALYLPSGALVACDPIEHPTSEPFDLALEPGRYLAHVIIAELRDESRVAYAVLELGSSPVRRWQIATVPEDDTSVLSCDEYGYTGISSLGCFMDAETANALIHAQEQHLEEEESELAKQLKALRRRITTRGVSWGMVEHPWLNGGNIAMFSTGFGEGLYRTYVGRDAEGHAVRMVTDFNVLELRFPSFALG